MPTRNQQPELASKLSDKGIRLTKQRRILIELIESTDQHLHPSDLLYQAREKGVKLDRTTVYRTLTMLKELGLVEELDLLHLNGHEHYYEVRHDRGHIHIGCISCGKILEFHTDCLPELCAEIQQKTGFIIKTVRTEVAAICPDCQRSM